MCTRILPHWICMVSNISSHSLAVAVAITTNIKQSRLNSRLVAANMPLTMQELGMALCSVVSCVCRLVCVPSRVCAVSCVSRLVCLPSRVLVLCRVVVSWPRGLPHDRLAQRAFFASFVLGTRPLPSPAHPLLILTLILIYTLLGVSPRVFTLYHCPSRHAACSLVPPRIATAPLLFPLFLVSPSSA